MSEQKFERVFRWLDLIRVVVYGLVAGAIGLSVWATKIQMTENDLEKRLNDMQQNVSIHRDALKEKEVQEEGRLKSLEVNVEWLKKAK
jgi:hypothetical protein